MEEINERLNSWEEMKNKNLVKATIALLCANISLCTAYRCIYIAGIAKGMHSFLAGVVKASQTSAEELE